LFGTAGGVGRVARAVLAARTGRGPGTTIASARVAARFTSRAGRISSRALGWDTMLPTSSCGTRMSQAAFGHTGFTGTSLWVDPDAGVYVVLLTNRVYPEPGPAEGITSFRRALHDAVMVDLERP
jgi:CubicO group peptidase (beta-lactamase class C family)